MTNIQTRIGRLTATRPFCCLTTTGHNPLIFFLLLFCIVFGPGRNSGDSRCIGVYCGTVCAPVLLAVSNWTHLHHWVGRRSSHHLQITTCHHLSRRKLSDVPYGGYSEFRLLCMDGDGNATEYCLNVNGNVSRFALNIRALHSDFWKLIVLT